MTENASLNIPRSDSIVEVHIIDTTTQLVVPSKAFVQPVLKGHETLNFPDFAFLVQNKQSGKKILFDSGCRKDWWNLSPAALKTIQEGLPALKVEKTINEILAEGGFNPNKLDGIVWSHWHWDHTGNASLFPKSTEIIVGPGFKQAFMPGYPAKLDSPLLETDFEYVSP
jgi:glyoxylase-like metal-dependent hydrolase (beta-lactamase superfamily II)